MQFVDERNTPAPQPAPTSATPPAPPQMPYRVTDLPYGMGRMMPTKFYGERGGEILSPDEIAIWARLQWLETALETAVLAPSSPAEEPPPAPYSVKMLPTGFPARTRAHKHKPGNYASELLSAEEEQVWRYLQTLEARWNALKGGDASPAASPDFRASPPAPLWPGDRPAPATNPLLPDMQPFAPASPEVESLLAATLWPTPIKPNTEPAATLRQTKILETGEILANPSVAAETLSNTITPAATAPELPPVTTPPAPGDPTADCLSISNVPQVEDSAPDAAKLETSSARATLQQAIESELLRDPTRPNGTIAEIVDCSDEKVRLTRRAMIAAGRIADVPIIRRDGTSYARDAASPTDAAPVGDAEAKPDAEEC